jgi:hypothetical protein
MQIRAKSVKNKNAELIPERIKRIEEQGIVGGRGRPANRDQELPEAN